MNVKKNVATVPVPVKNTKVQGPFEKKILLWVLMPVLVWVLIVRIVF
jgi:hypothetical protein